MTEEHQLSDLQLAIMRALWERGEATVAEVHARLEEERGLAPTTIATLLSRLEKRGLVAHRTERRQFVYCALVSEQEVRRSMVSGLVQRLFRGDTAAMLSHLLGSRAIGADELARVKALIESKEKEGEK